MVIGIVSMVIVSLLLARGSYRVISVELGDGSLSVLENVHYP